MPQTEKVFRFDRAEESSGFLLWQVSHLWQREIRKALEPYALTHSQFVILASIFWLSQKPESITQVTLSAQTKIDPMTTSTVLRTLQRRGLVQRAEHATDTRAKTVQLTDSGEKLVKQTVKVVEDFDHEFFDPLGAMAKKFNALLGVLLRRV